MKRHATMALFLMGIFAPLTVESAEAQGSRPARACSMDAMSEADKQRMITGYKRRLNAEGKASADAWAVEQGNAFRRKQVAAGICPPLSAKADVNTPPTRPAPTKKDKPCSRIRMESRATPNFGGAPMTMSLIPVCAD